jgi:glycosyltransferase involved in cell wall biosynthesis
MNILFLVYHGLAPDSGISKKILSQVKGLRQNGHRVAVCTYFLDARRHRIRCIDEEGSPQQCIADYGHGPLAALRKRISYGCIAQWAAAHHIEVAYVRSFHNANPFTIALFRRLRKAGIRVVQEIPTYPYDAEYANFSLYGKLELMVDKTFRRRLARTANALVTFTSEPQIFGQRTICISNGVDLDALPLQHPVPHPTDEVHLIGVAEVHFWHGFDRLIRGLGEYRRQPHEVRVVFHLVGHIDAPERWGSPFAEGIEPLIRQYGLEDDVVLHGSLHGAALDDVFNQAQLAVGSLARHRSRITRIRTLKNREYAARGIPFIYSEDDEDFDHQPYVMKVPADESPIPIQALVDFLRRQTMTAEAIRQTVEPLSWQHQMEKVIHELVTHS